MAVKSAPIPQKETEAAAEEEEEEDDPRGGVAGR